MELPTGSNFALALPRAQQVSLEDTPYYHCIARCVRRAYLCGDDPVSGKNFDHRKQWLVLRIKQLASIFAIDVCAYAVMSNHYHLVLHVDQEKAKKWSDEEVIKHWTALFPANGKLIETLYLNRNSKAAQKQLDRKLTEWRDRLTDLSWFMRCLNETVARQANREDECTGRFWEGRFKSQALLDEKALVTCMAYVDLNPVRAGVSETLENSDFTSIQERLIQHAKRVKNRSYRQHRLLTRRSAKHLIGRQSIGKRADLQPLSQIGGLRESTLPIDHQSYVELLESTCKIIGLEKAERKNALQTLEDNESLLKSLGITAQAWIRGATKFHRFNGNAAGSANSLITYQQHRIRAGVKLKYPDKWIRGIRPAQKLSAI